ncbi:hypothetical protein [Paenibacillus planticolens]|uniref:Uncharacterized protein n=1 Tax=Paenibacillus planticolens TaxID=2654976 RepID=A0ABX2A0X0_9BACL|nr:hypothetical protein [Paenibacillus planticolens]NOV04789.1 hypothetical protein [Paenibacillus planticolens]
MNELQNALAEFIESGSQANPALRTVIHDYAKYHAVLVIMGGLLVIIFAWLSIRFWAKSKRVPKVSGTKWNFEKKVYFSFGIMSCFVTLLMTLIVVANATNTFNPLHGFSLFVDSFVISDGVTYKDELRYAFNEWIKSGHANIPTIIQQKIHERIEFHTTKAMVCGVLLIIFVALGISLWNALIKRTTEMDSKWRYTEKAYFVFGTATVGLSLLLMVMVVANIQGAFTPLTAFLVGLFG